MQVNSTVSILEFEKSGFIALGFDISKNGGWNVRYSNGKRMFYYYIDIIILGIDFEFAIIF